MGCAGSAWMDTERKKTKRIRLMSATEKAFNAAILIQKWYRRYLARQEVRRRCSWTIFQSLEYAGEQDQTKLYNFFNDLITHLFDANPYIAASVTYPNQHIFKGKNPLLTRSDDEDADLWEKTQPDTVKVEEGYKGLKIKLPMKADTIVKLTEYFKSRRRLHAKYVLTIIHAARKILKYKPNINFASSVHSRQITICGDLHGKLEDLLTVFYKECRSLRRCFGVLPRDGRLPLMLLEDSSNISVCSPSVERKKSLRFCK